MNRIRVNGSRVLQRLAQYSSPAVRLVLASRAHVLISRRLMLLAFTGRRTARAYTTPVSYVREGSDLLIPGGGAWWKNLASGPISVRLQGSWRAVSHEVITEPLALSEVLRRMMSANPALSAFTGIRPGPDGRPTTESLERERRRGFVVVRLHLDGEDGAVRVA